MAVDNLYFAYAEFESAGGSTKLVMKCQKITNRTEDQFRDDFDDKDVDPRDPPNEYSFMAPADSQWDCVVIENDSALIWFQSFIDNLHFQRKSGRFLYFDDPAHEDGQLIAVKPGPSGDGTKSRILMEFQNENGEMGGYPYYINMVITDEQAAGGRKFTPIVVDPKIKNN